MLVVDSVVFYRGQSGVTVQCSEVERGTFFYVAVKIRNLHSLVMNTWLTRWVGCQQLQQETIEGRRNMTGELQSALVHC